MASSEAQVAGTQLQPGQGTFQPLLLPAAAVPADAGKIPRDAEECALFGLSTTVANERLVEELEDIVLRYTELVKAVTWRARLSFLQTPEGAIAPLCILAFGVVAAFAEDRLIIGEILLVLPFHLLAWYISFRLPRAEQLRAVAKVRDALQRFVASEDAFTQTSGGSSASEQSHVEAVPPSSLCVSVLRDRGWRQIPFNMVVEGDVFKLREGETFPCQAERLMSRPPHGAIPSGQVFNAGDTFTPTVASRGSSRLPADIPAVGSFLARSTACLPFVQKFLHTAQRSSEGRTDTVFFELAALVRRRLKKVSLAAFLVSMAACCSWLCQPAVMEQSIEWHFHRFLLPVRLVLCLVPLTPAILLQLTDVWGNARIQSLFEWHAGLAAEERDDWRQLKGLSSLEQSDEQSPGSGEIDASQVPLHRQLRELFDILGQGLDGPSNLMHTLNSTTVVCFCDREGLLTDTCATITEVCLCSSGKKAQASDGDDDQHRAPRKQNSPSKQESSEAFPPSGQEARQWPGDSQRALDRDATVSQHEASEEISLQEASTFSTIVLDLQAEPSVLCGLRFEDADWRTYLPNLKPLGLSLAVSRQPRELFSQADDGHKLFDLMAGDLLQAMQRGASAAMHDCVCNVSKLIGFKDDVLAGFKDVKFCMEVCRPLKLQQRSEASTPAERRLAASSPGTIAQHARPHVAWRAAPSPNSDPTSPGPALSSREQDPVGLPPSAQTSRTNHDSTHHASEDLDTPKRLENESAEPESAVESRTNFSQTLLTWFVEDPRDGSYQMFCKGKPKRLLPKCTHYFDGHKVVPLQEEDRQSLTRLVLQWKASGLSALAYSYRPLTAQAEIDVCSQLGKHSFFCATEDGAGNYDIVEAGKAGCKDGIDSSPFSSPSARLATAWKDLHSEQVLLGMAGVKLCASVQMASYAEALQSAGIRFQVYSAEGEKRTRTLGSQLGLETGWNCLISLEPSAKEVKNMMGQVVLPSGIANIRKHTKEVDNVPLLVSLYSKATPWRAQQMISIMQEHTECVTCVGSALQPNFETFRQANISVSVLVNSVPQCRRCFGRREPRPSHCLQDDLLIASTVNRAEFQLSADLTSLPCALQARHSFSNGEQRTLGVLFNAIKEARRCVDCILMVLIHYLCGAVELAVVVALQSLLCLPPPMVGFHILSILLVLLPIVSICLLFNSASPQIMKELPLKKADEKTLAQPGRLMILYALRSVPSALVVVVAFVHDLHRLFSWQLEKAMTSERFQTLAEPCKGFAWHWWLTGKWPRCTMALNSGDITRSTWSPSSAAASSEGRCALVHAQHWCALVFVIYHVALAFTFLDRYDSLLTRGPASNKILCSTAILTLLTHAVISYCIIQFECGQAWDEIMVPPWQFWLGYVAIWPLLAVLVSEVTKRRDRRYHMHLQKTLRILFNTRLGMWSPK